MFILRLLFLFCILFTPRILYCIELLGETNNTSYSIQLASFADLESIMALDIAISYEYFKPLFLQYPEFEGKENEVEKMLADEIETDNLWFADCIAMKEYQRLFIACQNNNCVGFVACHRQDAAIIVIDLLMIAAENRGKGIGKQLIHTCILAFPEASTCMLIVLDKNKQACDVYEKIGFILMNEKPSFVQEKYSHPRYICYQWSKFNNNLL